jgi:hypothetical protein
MAEVRVRLAFEDPCRACPCSARWATIPAQVMASYFHPNREIAAVQGPHIGVVFSTILQTDSKLIGLGAHYSNQLFDLPRTVSFISVNV